jgi:hypothetical protein
MGGGWQREGGRRVPSPFKKLSKIHKVGFKKLAEKKRRKQYKKLYLDYLKRWDNGGSKGK